VLYWWFSVDSLDAAQRNGKTPTGESRNGRALWRRMKQRLEKETCNVNQPRPQKAQQTNARKTLTWEPWNAKLSYASQRHTKVRSKKNKAKLRANESQAKSHIVKLLHSKRSKGKYCQLKWSEATRGQGMLSQSIYHTIVIAIYLNYTELWSVSLFHKRIPQYKSTFSNLLRSHRNFDPTILKTKSFCTTVERRGRSSVLVLPFCCACINMELFHKWM
jgi:hypothetical protein